MQTKVLSVTESTVVDQKQPYGVMHVTKLVHSQTTLKKRKISTRLEFHSHNMTTL